MLVLLRTLADELAGSTDARPWTAKVGLASGAIVEPGRIILDHLPTVVLEARRGRTVTYTTLRDIVQLELSKGGLLRLETALETGRRAAADALEEVP